jgi:hypothetical protein
MNPFNYIIDWLKEQWQKLSLEYIIYLMAFSFILDHITNYLLKFRGIRWIYYSTFIILLIKLIEGGHPVGAVETIYKLNLI